MARKVGSDAKITGPAIRVAALRLFAKSGYAAVSMREIARSVGLQAGALYLYTPDKQTLLFDLMRGHLQDALTRWRAVCPEGPPIDRLEAFVRFHVDYHFDRRDEVFLAYMELRNLTPENFAVIETLRHDYEAELEAILSDGNAVNQFRLADAKVTAMALIAMLNGVTTWYREGGRLSRDRIRRIYWNMTRRMVKA